MTLALRSATSFRLRLLCCLFSVLGLLPGLLSAETPLQVYTAKKIITMDRTLPEAQAVAVAEGRIVAVGSLESMDAWLQSREHVIDERFKDKVLLPGLIENHLHPFLAATLLNTTWITPHEWNLPGLSVERTRGREAYLAAVRAAVETAPASNEPFITWGYHETWHGLVRRADLDRISSERPIILWQRSFHEIIANSAALRWMGFNPETDEPPEEVDFATGRFSERGLLAALGPVAGYLLAPEKLAHGLQRVKDIVWRGGITTMADMGIGAYSGFETEAAVQKQAFGTDDTPFRTILVPAVIDPSPEQGLESMVETFKGYQALSTSKVRVPHQVKFLADGAFFAQYMRMNPPGYIDGHEGKWLTPPDDLAAAMKAFWNQGFQIHVHVNGDEGLDVVLDTLAMLLDQKPRFDHRFTLHHVGYSTNDQLRRAAGLGVAISAQPYYLWALSDAYAKHGLGYDRASQMSRLGSMVENGIPLSLHSDFTMAPAAPLTLAWVAVNRITAEGSLMAPEERLSVEQALRAVTIDAAFALRMEDEIGSIVAGKRADFTVLEQDPFEVPPIELKDLEIWGTVFEGRVFPIP
jgi:predicted amidohydrolase YtcJ